MVLKFKYKKLGYDYKRNTLCTIDLSKKLILNQSSYSLGKLVNNLGIAVSNRHRASGDAFATLQLFKILLEKDLSKEIFKQTIKYFDKQKNSFLINKILENLPNDEGIFYIHNDDGNVVFLGKGKNIRFEVNKLLLKQSKRAKKISKIIKHVSYEKTGNLLITRLKFYSELEFLKPKYNIIKKRKITNKKFNNNNLLIVNKGRFLGENSIILIKENEVICYT